MPLNEEKSPQLVRVARAYFRRRGIDATIHLGSYKPAGAYEETATSSWNEKLRLDTAGVDVIYAYPWPAERRSVDWQFRRFARPGSLLVTYYGGGDIRIFRQPLA